MNSQSRLFQTSSIRAAGPLPARPLVWAPWERGLFLVGALALLKLVMHLLTSNLFGYSYFVDELYYLACSEHLAWGFVDMPPLFPALTAAVRFLLGDSLLAVRLLPGLAGALLVLLTGLLAREMGGDRFAQGLAALAVVTVPIFLVMHSMHTVNALEPLFWMGCAWVLLRLINGGNPKVWLLFGLLAGIGLLNKHSMAFFGAALVPALLLTPQRSVFRNRWIWLGGGVALLIFLPNLVWLIENGFPYFEMLANIRADGRNVSLTPLQFLGQQVLLMHPVALLIWLPGLLELILGREGKSYRPLGITYLGILTLLLLLDGRVYYLAPAYPMLLAAGGVFHERWMGQRSGLVWKPVALALLTIGGALMAPLWLPCLPPETFVRYANAWGMNQLRIETHRLGPLPQLFADRFGWREMAEEVARIYHGLPAEERPETAIFGQNYGQVGAIDLFGPALGLPKALSGHLAYHDWGPRGHTGQTLIVMDDDRETLETHFRSVELAGRVQHPYSMPYQHFDVFVCRGLRRPLAEVWPQLRQLN